MLSILRDEYYPAQLQQSELISSVVVTTTRKMLALSPENSSGSTSVYFSSSIAPAWQPSASSTSMAGGDGTGDSGYFPETSERVDTVRVSITFRRITCICTDFFYATFSAQSVSRWS